MWPGQARGWPGPHGSRGAYDYANSGSHAAPRGTTSPRISRGITLFRDGTWVAEESFVRFSSPSTPRRSLLPRLTTIAGAALAACLGVGGTAKAGGMVVGGTGPVSMRVAASSDGTRTTRWQAVVVPPGERVTWLVPARPGARVDLGGEAFMRALDETTAVRVVRPNGGTTACGPEGVFETIDEGTPNERADLDGAPVVLTGGADLDALAAARGLSLPAGLSARAFRDGFQLVALSFQPSARPTTTPVVRVTDDGPMSLPIVLGHAATRDVTVTTYVIAEGSQSVGTRVALPETQVTWGMRGSSYRTAREAALAPYRGFGFLTEAAGHDLVFGPRPSLPEGTLPPSLVSAYAMRVSRSPQEAAACASTLAAMTNHPVRFGTACSRGELARLAPEAECTDTSGGADVTHATCGTSSDDLAVALAGKRIDAIAVTRAVGIVPAGSTGGLVAIAPGSAKEPTVTPRLDETCLPPTPFRPTPSPSSAPPFASDWPTPEQPSPATPRYKSTYSDGCGGGTMVVTDTTSDTTYEDTGASDSCSSDTSDSSSDSSSDDVGCGGDTVGGDNDGSSDACSSDSSSDSSDSCSSSSGDSCDSPETRNHKGRRGKSPVSRAAFLVVALLLPLRRMAKKRENG